MTKQEHGESANFGISVGPEVYKKSIFGVRVTGLFRLALAVQNCDLYCVSLLYNTESRFYVIRPSRKIFCVSFSLFASLAMVPEKTASESIGYLFHFVISGKTSASVTRYERLRTPL